ncbi:MAG TPA: ribonuclease P protein component 1 [Candidatus Altiarchaeales archaeon]|nr:ribonuclease P protein component 1 [Candidatus Altiarchaeales archaeon]
MITPQNILRHELSGLRAKVTCKTGKTRLHAGEVCGETRDTIKIKTEKGVKTFPKEGVIIRLTLPQKEVVELDGTLLIGRPQDRVKKKFRITY